ncbi:putative dTDP-glucose 4,6-dehydratase, rfbB [Chlamydiales bacterium STE3]|nr:putative dTDP-glucose 4,6-dehydratase, rfbB [Chlamydiales bacterium STE3]
MIGLTGATGFIGSYIVPSLSYAKRVLVRNTMPRVNLMAGDEVFVGDLCHKEQMHSFVQNCPFLLHLACNSNPLFSSGRLIADLESNLLPTIQLFETYAVQNPNGHIIFASTGGNMYEDLHSSAPKNEEDLPHPRSGYSVHKLAAEHYLRLIASSYGIKATILRLSNPYGAIVDNKRRQGLIGVAFAKLLSNEPLLVYDSIKTLRDYIHLEDVVRFLRCIIEQSSRNNNIEIYNVSSGVGLSIAQVIHEVECVTGKKLKVEYTQEGTKMTPSCSILSWQKAFQDLGWRPTINFNDGLKMMLQLSEKLQHL